MSEVSTDRRHSGSDSGFGYRSNTEPFLDCFALAAGAGGSRNRPPLHYNRGPENGRLTAGRRACRRSCLQPVCSYADELAGHIAPKRRDGDHSL